jgi:hypothetical protein
MAKKENDSWYREGSRVFAPLRINIPMPPGVKVPRQWSQEQPAMQPEQTQPAMQPEQTQPATS